MKKVIVILSLLLFTGCMSKEEKELKKQEEKLLGTWETKYELGAFGEVSEKYIFKKNNECIRIIWEDKIDKESYSKYEEVDDKTIIISEHIYKKEEANEK